MSMALGMKARVLMEKSSISKTLTNVAWSQVKSKTKLERFASKQLVQIGIRVDVSTTRIAVVDLSAAFPDGIQNSPMMAGIATIRRNRMGNNSRKTSLYKGLLKPRPLTRLGGNRDIARGRCGGVPRRGGSAVARVGRSIGGRSKAMATDAQERRVGGDFPHPT